MWNLNIKCNNDYSVQNDESLLRHCYLREESENGIRKWEEMWFKMTAENGEREGGSSDVWWKTVQEVAEAGLFLTGPVLFCCPVSHHLYIIVYIIVLNKCMLWHAQVWMLKSDHSALAESPQLNQLHYPKFQEPVIYNVSHVCWLNDW